MRPKVCRIYPFVDFFMVVEPCMLGRDILDIIIKNGNLFIDNKNDNQKLQKLYDNRVNFLDAIAGTEKTKGVEYKSIYVDKNMLVKIIKILKKNNGN